MADQRQSRRFAGVGGGRARHGSRHHDVDHRPARGAWPGDPQALERRPPAPGVVPDAGRHLAAAQSENAHCRARGAHQGAVQARRAGGTARGAQEIPGSALSVTFETRGNVAVALVDRPPVNAIDATVRAGLLDAVQRAGANPAVAALVLACRGRTFMSGADLSELGSAIAAPPYAEVLRALENFNRPVIAAMHGTPM